MKTEIVTTKFDYSQLVENISSQLIESSIIIRESMKRTCQEIVLIGKELIKAKELLEHGEFINWIESEFQLSRQMANNFIHAAEVYGKCKIILHFKPTVLYELAAPSTPIEVRQQIEQKVEQGEKVTIKEIKDLKKQVKQKEIHIKELSKTVDNSDQFYKQTIKEIEQQTQETLKQLSNDSEQKDQTIKQLQKQIDEFESRTPIPEPQYEPIPIEIEPENNNGEYKEKIKQLEKEIAALGADNQQLKENKANETMTVIQRMKSNFDNKEQQYQDTIENLKSKIENQDDGNGSIEDPIYETDEFNFNIVTISQGLDYIEENNLYNNEPIRVQLEQLNERITGILDRMELEVF